MTSRFATGLSDEELRRKIQFLGIPPEIVAGLDPDAATCNLIPLVAPFDGVVIDHEIVTGEVVQTGHTQFVIADVSRVWLKLNVKKTDAIRLEIGQEILFASDGIPGEVECKLTWIGTEVDEKTRTVQVRGETDNPLVGTKTEAEGGQRLLRTHTFGTAGIRVREDRRTVMVPSSAIQWDGRQHLVFVPLPDGRSFQPRAVTLGVSREGQTEVVQGIAPGEPVVSAGSYVLKSEMGREQAAARP
jgi:cobalt-zinc-cadmium efflux system membrane fusion protein